MLLDARDRRSALNTTREAASRPDARAELDTLATSAGQRGPRRGDLAGKTLADRYDVLELSASAAWARCIARAIASSTRSSR